MVTDRPEELDGDGLDLDGLLRKLYWYIERNAFAGGNILRGEFPRLATVTEEAFADMTAKSELRGAFFLVLGGTGVADTIYTCIKNAGDSYEFAATTFV